MIFAPAPGPPNPGRVRAARIALYAALALLAYLANGYPVRLTNGADILTGTAFWMLAAAVGGPWIGMLVAGAAAMRTVALFGHPWAIPLFVLEAGVVGARARRGHTPVGSSLLYWTFAGAPLLIGIYGWHLGLPAEVTGLIGLADFSSSLAGAIVAHVFLSMAPAGGMERAGVPKPQYALREHIWVGALAFGIAPLFFLLRYAGGDLQAVRVVEIQEQLENVAEDFASHLGEDTPAGYSPARVTERDGGWIDVVWQGPESEGATKRGEYTVSFRVADWYRRRSHIRELTLYCFRGDGELLYRVPARAPRPEESLEQRLTWAHADRTFTFQRLSGDPFSKQLQVAARIEAPGGRLVVVAVQPLAAANAVGRVAREVALRWISGTILMSLLFGAWFSRRLTRKLQRLVDSMEPALRQDGVLGDCPAGASPEVRLLWSGFQQLQGKLAAALADQRKAVELATQAVREKSSFLAAVSHEIRGPMTRILGSAVLLQSRNSSLPPEEGLRMIQRSSDHVMSILEDVTDFCTLEVDRMTIRPAHFPLAAALAELLQWIETEASSKDIEVGLLVAPDVPFTVYADRTRLTQILYNLVQNAVKFTDRGEVRVEVRAGRRATESDSREVEFRIRDTGDGIPAEWQQQVFEPFFHRTRPLARPRNGSGLGLAIVRRLTQAMGGTVSLESRVGEGTTITVRLPIGPGRTVKEPLREHLRSEALFTMPPSVSREELISQWSYLGMPYRLGWTELESPTGQEPMARLVFADLEELLGDLDGISQRVSRAGCRRIVAVESRAKWSSANLPAEWNGVYFHRLRWPACVFQLPEAMQAILLSQGERTVAPGVAEDGPRGLWILAAEDNADSRRVLELSLRNLGHGVVSVSNGQEALEALRSRKFDVVLLDIEMPELNGLEALAVIRNNPETAWLPVYALTAHASEAKQAEFLMAGFTGHVGKPYTLETLAEVLRGQGRPEASGWDGGPVDDGIFGRYAELLRQAGEEVAPALGLILGEVRAWLETTPEAGEAAGVTAHSLAGSCSLIGARKLAGVLKELSEMAEGTARSRWNAGLAEAGEALREAEGHFMEAQAKAART